MARGDKAELASRLKWEHLLVARKLIDRKAGFARLSSRTLAPRHGAPRVHFATAERLVRLMPRTYQIEATMRGRIIRNIKRKPQEPPL